MKAHRTQALPTSIAEARAIRESLRDKVVARDRHGKISTVAGVDVGFEKHGSVTRAAVVVLGFPGLAPMEQAVARQPTRFPYVPGYLSFREARAPPCAWAGRPARCMFSMPGAERVLTWVKPRRNLRS